VGIARPRIGAHIAGTTILPGIASRRSHHHGGPRGKGSLRRRDLLRGGDELFGRGREP
jgi:hypothetical protein